MKKILGLVVALVVLGVFLWKEYSVVALPVPLIVAEENVVLLRVSTDRVFGMGNLESPRARAVSRSLLSFFTLGEIASIWDISVGGELRGNDFVIQRVSENLVRSVCGGRVVWWIGDGFSVSEREMVIASGVDLDADFWVMIKNRLVDFLPDPREGIIYAGDRVPSVKTADFAKTKKIPLISVKETGGMLLEYAEGKEWVLTTRN